MKRILATALAVLLVASMAIGGSVAYLTSTDDDTNIFAMGDVDIVQHEKDESGADYVDGQRLLPSSSFKKDAASYGKNETTGYWSAKNGEIDKVVTVENTGDTSAYVRTIFAFEDTADVDTDGLIIKNWKDAKNVTKVLGTAEIDGVFYNLYTYTYPTALAKSETTAPSLMQIAMAAEADNAVVDAIAAIGDYKYTVLVATQAVQAENMKSFNSASAALDAAFGKITANQNPWRDLPENAVKVNTADALKSGLSSTDPVYLTDDVEIDFNNMYTTTDIEINLEGNKLTSTGKALTLSSGADLTLKDGEFEMTNDFAYINARPSNPEDPTEIVSENMTYTNTYKKASNGPCTNRVEAAVKVTSNTVGDNEATVYFKNSTFNNQSVEFRGLSDGKNLVVDATFENCTFNALTCNALIKSDYFVTGTITLKNCTFNIEATGILSAVDVSYNAGIKLKLEGTNVLNVKLATATGAELTGTVDEVMVSSAFDLADIKFANYKNESAQLVSGSATPTINVIS